MVSAAVVVPDALELPLPRKSGRGREKREEGKRERELPQAACLPKLRDVTQEDLPDEVASLSRNFGGPREG